jgi:hypothetical protein
MALPLNSLSLVAKLGYLVDPSKAQELEGCEGEGLLKRATLGSRSMTDTWRSVKGGRKSD